MRIILSITLSLTLALACAAQAQVTTPAAPPSEPCSSTAIPTPAPACRLAWDIAAETGPIDRFDVLVDGVRVTGMTYSTPVFGGSYGITFPTLTPGAHTITVVACQNGQPEVCASSSPFAVTVLPPPPPPPAMPTSLRVGPNGL